MSTVPVQYGYYLAGGLFAIGLIGVLVRRNIFFILISIEIMLNAAGMMFIIAGAQWGQPDGQMMFIFILAVAASEVAIGLAMVLQIFHRRKTLDADDISRMRG